MLRVYVPELFQFNTELAGKLFEPIWESYKAEAIAGRADLWVRRDEFMYASMDIFLKHFALTFCEILDAVNMRRPFDLADVNYDFDNEMNCYVHDEDEEDPDFEGECLCFMSYVANKLVTKQLTDIVIYKYNTIFETLWRLLEQTHGVTGFWINDFEMDRQLWEAHPFVVAIQEGDYEPIWHGPWQHGSGTMFYQLASNTEIEFYLWEDAVVMVDPRTAIPEREPVTLCRLTPNASDFIENLSF